MTMYEDALEDLESALEQPIIVIASKWRGERAVDFDRDAVRIVADILDALGEGPAPEALGLVLLGRGGYPSFADGIVRLFEGFDVNCTCLIPDIVDGAYTLIALAADRLSLHPYGGLGAFDAPPARRLQGRLDLETLSALEARGLPHPVDDEQRPELAQTAHLQQLARHQFDRLVGRDSPRADSHLADALGWDRLGRQLALSAAELAELDLPASRVSPEIRAPLWRLHAALESTLELRGAPPERYTESDYAEEVEFEPAEWIPGGLIASRHHTALYELDTGQPDPDTNMLEGAWSRPDDM